MMSIKSFFNRFSFWKRGANQGISFNTSDCSTEYRLASTLERYEKYLTQIQSIIMWDHPSISVLCVMLVNIIFWIFLSLEWKFYGIVSSILLVMTAHDAWTVHVWPEISVGRNVSKLALHQHTSPYPSVMAKSKMLTSIYITINQYVTWLRNLRLQQPGLFCCACSLVCSSLLMLGRSVSGLLIAYLLLMSVLIGPGIIAQYLPPELKQTLIQYTICVNEAFAKYSANDTSDDEYLPVTTSEDIALLTRASDLHNDTYDSITNPGSSSDMASGLGLMPSHEEDSLGTLSDLEPGVSQLPMDPADDSDSNPGDHQIQFQSGHFNGDSSSSDEEAFSRDLVFTETDEKDSAALRGLTDIITQAVASNVLGSVGLLANVMRPLQTQVQALAPAGDGIRQRTNRRTETDSDLDDFEFINRDELNTQDSS